MPVSFDVFSISFDTVTPILLNYSSNNIPNATFTTTVNKDTTFGKFTWIPGNRVGNFNFTIQAIAKTCPLKRQNIFNYSIRIDTVFSKCKDTTLYLPPSGIYTIDSSFVLDMSNASICAIQKVELSKDTFYCYELGVNPVTVTTYYENGNIKSFVKATLYSPFIVSHLAGPGGYTTIYNDTIGLLWVQTRYYGCFAFGIVCEEFRNGIKIGEVYKDFVMCNPGIWFGTQELNFLDMSVIYPNPSNGVVNIKSEGIEIIQIQVLGLNGNLLQTIKKGKKNKLDLSHLSPGIYFLRLNSNNGLVTKKIVIN